MTKKERQDFCYGLANFMCYPDSIELFSASQKLVTIIRDLTRGNKKIREEVLDICKDMVVDEHYDKSAYSEYMNVSMAMITEDYDKVFFK